MILKINENKIKVKKISITGTGENILFPIIKFTTEENVLTIIQSFFKQVVNINIDENININNFKVTLAENIVNEEAEEQYNYILEGVIS